MKRTPSAATLLIGAVFVFVSQFWFIAETEAPPGTPEFNAFGRKP